MNCFYTCKFIYDNILRCLKIPSVDGACPNYCLRLILGFTCSFSYRVIFKIGISPSACYFFFFSFFFRYLLFWLFSWILISRGGDPTFNPHPSPPVHWRTAVGKEKKLEWTRTQICENILQKNMFKCWDRKIWVLWWHQYCSLSCASSWFLLK